jgi:hypothetical protein
VLTQVKPRCVVPFLSLYAAGLNRAGPDAVVGFCMQARILARWLCAIRCILHIAVDGLGQGVSVLKREVDKANSHYFPVLDYKAVGELY